MKVVLLLAALGAAANPSPQLGQPTVPMGTPLLINATVCLSKANMDTLVETEKNGGDVNKVGATLTDCTNLCMKVIVVRETDQFVMRDQRPFKVFEVIGNTGSQQSFWAATQVDASGWPIKAVAGLRDSQCATENQEF